MNPNHREQAPQGGQNRNTHAPGAHAASFPQNQWLANNGAAAFNNGAAARGNMQQHLAQHTLQNNMRPMQQQYMQPTQQILTNNNMHNLPLVNGGMYQYQQQHHHQQQQQQHPHHQQQHYQPQQFFQQQQQVRVAPTYHRQQQGSSLALDIFGEADEDQPPSIQVNNRYGAQRRQRNAFSVPSYSTPTAPSRATANNRRNRQRRKTATELDEPDPEEPDEDFVLADDDYLMDEEDDAHLGELHIAHHPTRTRAAASSANDLPVLPPEEEFDFENMTDDEEEHVDAYEPEHQPRFSSRRSRKKQTRAKNVDFQEYFEDDDTFFVDSDEEKVAKAKRRVKQAQPKKTEAPLIPEYIPGLLHIESILDHRDTVHREQTVPEYLIKWETRSHIHNTWHVEWELKGLKGMKKLANYKKRVKDLDKWKKNATEEEVEQQSVYEELQRDLQHHWTQVERIIDRRVAPPTPTLPTKASAQPANDNEEYVPPSETSTTDHSSNDANKTIQYLVKWKYLPYSESTWEDEGNIQASAQDKIDAYNERTATLPYKYHPSTDKQRSPESFQRMEKQPAYVAGGELRDYQLEGVNWMHFSWCKRTNIIMADEMGLGKTIQTISFLNILHHEHDVKGPFLVVVPLSTINGWIKEFKKWAPSLYIIPYVGNSKSRKIAREYEFFIDGGFPTKAEASKRDQAEFHDDSKEYKGLNRTYRFHVLLTTYELVIKDAEFLNRLSWANLSVDEAHRLKNDKAKLYEKLFEFDKESTLLITGTPLQNTMKELWCLLHFLEPDKYASLDEFNEKYGDLQNKDSVDVLHKDLQPHILRRMKTDVEKSLPKKIERILRVGLSSLQKEYYKWILTRNYKELNATGHNTNMSNIVIQLKKVCNHPYLFPSAREKMEEQENNNRLNAIINASGKMWLLDKLLDRLKETGHRVLIFSQMVMVLDVLSEYLSLKGHQFQRLDGSTPSQQRIQAVNHYNEEGSKDFVFLLTTRAGGLGINLATADTVVIFDSDWNPQQDLQACARAHRIGQKSVVNIYRLITKDTVEEKILEQAKQKMILDHVVIQKMDTSGRVVLSGKSNEKKKNQFTKKDLNAILQFGATNLFSEENDKTAEAQAPSLDDILARAEVTSEGGDASSSKTESVATEGEGGSSLMGSFSVSNFVAPGAEGNDSDIAELTKKQELGKKKSNKGRGRGRRSNKDFWKSVIPEAAIDDYSNITQAYPSRRRTKRKNYNEESLTVTDDLMDSETANARRLCNFSLHDTRRFLTKFKQFPDLDRVEHFDIGKSVSDTKEFAQLLIEKCRSASKDSPAYQPKFIKFNGIEVDAEEIARLNKQVTVLKRVIGQYKTLMKDKQVGVEVVSEWPIKWTLNDDNNLLRGILKHGIGNWEQIREDEKLGLKYKICPAHSNAYKRAKPQQISRRVDVLLSDAYERFSSMSEEELQGQQKPSIMKIRIKKRTNNSSRLSEAQCASLLCEMEGVLVELEQRGARGESPSDESFGQQLRQIGDAIEQQAAQGDKADEVDLRRKSLWSYVNKRVGSIPEPLQQVYAHVKQGAKRKRDEASLQEDSGMRKRTAF